MTGDLLTLIGQARALAGDHPCSVIGHDWRDDGGRACPRSEANGGDCDGSQPVLVCAKCGDEDYGDVGGPACCETGACGTARPGFQAGVAPPRRRMLPRPVLSPIAGNDLEPS